MRKHYISLLLITIITRLIMFLSYPIGLLDDNDHAQMYLINLLNNGNYLIGNFRYNTGYAFVFAPFWNFSEIFGTQLQDRIFLLIQLGLTVTIPFFVYAILSKRGQNNLAFFSAILLAIEPFGLQWAHFILPEWWIAFCFIVALWAMQNDSPSGMYHYFWIVFAAALMGLACLARLNIIPLIAIMGFALLFQHTYTKRQKFLRFMLFGTISAGILGAYLLAIHYPSVGSSQISCISNLNRFASLIYKGIPITVENGDETRNYVQLAALPSNRDDLTFYVDSYPLWQIAGPWLSAEETSAFFQQSVPSDYPTRIYAVSDSELSYYLGPCELDRLLASVVHEAIAAYPIDWALGVLRDSFFVITQYPKDLIFDNQYLPSPEQLEFSSDSLFGLQKANGAFYNGQRVWSAGIQLYTTYFQVQWFFGLLYLPAILWAIWKRDWFNTLLALLIIVLAITIALFSKPEPRYYADIYPFYVIVLGKFIFDIVSFIHAKVQHK